MSLDVRSAETMPEVAVTPADAMEKSPEPETLPPPPTAESQEGPGSKMGENNYAADYARYTLQNFRGEAAAATDDIDKVPSDDDVAPMSGAKPQATGPTASTYVINQVLVGNWDSLSGEQQRLFTSYVQRNNSGQFEGKPAGEFAADFWNRSAEAANANPPGSAGFERPRPDGLLTQSQLTTFVGVTSMWESTGVAGRIEAVNEIRGDVDKDSFSLRGTFRPGGGEYINRAWNNIPGITHAPYNISRRQRGVFSEPNGQFKMTDDLRGFQSDVDYSRSISFPFIFNRAHLQRSNSDIRYRNNMQKHNNEYRQGNNPLRLKPYDGPVGPGSGGGDGGPVLVLN